MEDTATKVDDGGPAFPVTTGMAIGDRSITTAKSAGMTLRDYFAAKAMQAAFAGDGASMIANRDERYDETNWSWVVAANAYEMADAMLAARQPPAPTPERT